jgi:subtilisin family serine protease
LDKLRAYGAHVLNSDAFSGIVYAQLPIATLETVAALPFIRWVGPPAYAVRRVGSVTSEGDTRMQAAALRDMLNIDGTGVRVGIISDGLVNLQASVNSGDLPDNVIIVNGQNGAGPDNPDNTDEGRAMAEIIHDLAPGATLLFHTGFPDSMKMIDAIEALTEADADVIVDDLGFFREPSFQDGPVARAVQRAIRHGVVYVTAAGNSAHQHFQAPYRELTPNDGDPTTNLHDFGGGDTRLDIRVPAHGVVSVFLQWPNRFNSSANTADYDLLLVDVDGNTIASSDEDQLGTPADPIEAVAFQNTSAVPRTVGVVINRVAGAALPLELYFNGAAQLLEHNVPGSSISGHPCVRNAIAVGAIDVNDRRFNTIEPFSSQGPCEIFFPDFEIRSKPDVAAADGVATSLARFNPFFGTSAAAPHVAAVVALLLEAAGGPGAIRNTDLVNILRFAAVDIDSSGVDPRAGYGVVKAVRAAKVLQGGVNNAPRSVIAAPADDISIPPGTALDMRGNCVDVEGDRPFTFAWDFDGVVPASTDQNPENIPFANVGVFRMTFTCTDALGMVDPTPAVRTVTVNRPPNSTMTEPDAATTITVGERLAFRGTCRDPENHMPFTFRWNFGGGATITTSPQQNLASVVFNQPGTFTVLFTCTDALDTSDPTPATVQITVNPPADDDGDDNGGGGGCSILPAAQSGAGSFGAALGNMFLPLVVLGGLRLWRWYRGRRQ